MTTSLVPETAPFNKEQRAWLNGFLSGFIGLPGGDSLAADMLSDSSSDAHPPSVEDDADDGPWHDPSLPILDRMELAEGKPLAHQLMATMAQLDCGSCGYLCKTYSAAIASGDEKNLTLCSPGGKETSRMIKNVLRTQEVISPKNETQSSKKLTTEVESKWSRLNPFPAKLIESRPLNREGSSKDTRHVAIDLAGSGMTYSVGDALGVYPTNCNKLARELVAHLASQPQTMVRSPTGDKKSFLEALSQDCCLKEPSDELLELLLDRITDPQTNAELQKLLDDGVPDGFDVLDTLALAQGAQITATEFIETLNPLNPRLYSIASSMRAVGEEVHLTVGKVVYERGGRTRTGAASGMLAERTHVGESVRVFVAPNHGGFTVPRDPKKAMIMVGPGTGIAPFMSFLQERSITGAAGKNWLLFGDQHSATDFLYEEELRRYQSSGLLTRMDTAFSRDDSRKVYVQDRMLENAAEFWRWLQEGAHFYVCGDASRMAADVDRTLKMIVSKEGSMSEKSAGDYVKSLASDARYVRDVY